MDLCGFEVDIVNSKLSRDIERDLIFLFVCFRDRVSLCVVLAVLELSVDQAVLKLLPLSVS